jgi:hypothetical protein
VRGFPVDVPKALQEVFFRTTVQQKFTVHTATQSCPRQEKQQEVSDEAIVMMMSAERRME